MWPDQSFIGIVRLRNSDITILDAGGGRWIKLPTREDVKYNEGYTVEAKHSYGVIRILAEEPIKYIDLPAIDDTVISTFKLQKESITDTFDSFGGLHNVVEQAKELIEVHLKRKESFSEIGIDPIKGVLFTGPPGTGKKMLARIIAKSTDSEFYEIRGPEIFSKWYGQSEELLRKLFADAEKQARAIIFFDEVDSVAGQRVDESHEASRRIVAQLLTLMDGFQKNNVTVIATSNRPQDIDVALRRPGRFDREINFPMPNFNDREAILRASTHRRKVYGNLPHTWIAQNTENWSAADLAGIWREAATLAVRDNRKVIMTEDYIGGFERVYTQKKHRVVKSLPRSGSK